MPIVGNKISENITQKNIELLYLGMSKDKLINILDEPFKKFYKRGMHYFVYSKAGIGVGQIEIYLYIKNDRLNGILMEFDDRGFYYCSNQKCPKVLDQQMYDSNIPID